jgi:hypothetical protein
MLSFQLRNRPFQTRGTNEPDEVMPYVRALAVWPLTIVPSLGEVESSIQGGWLRYELACLGTILGDGLLESAKTGPWGMI